MPVGVPTECECCGPVDCEEECAGIEEACADPDSTECADARAACAACPDCPSAFAEWMGCVDLGPAEGVIIEFHCSETCPPEPDALPFWCEHLSCMAAWYITECEDEIGGEFPECLGLACSPTCNMLTWTYTSVVSCHHPFTGEPQC